MEFLIHKTKKKRKVENVMKEGKNQEREGNNEEMVKPKKDNVPPDKALITVRLKRKKKPHDIISKNKFKRATYMFYNGTMVEKFLKTTKRGKLNEGKLLIQTLLLV
jgi:hypothetical protein